MPCTNPPIDPYDAEQFLKDIENLFQYGGEAGDFIEQFPNTEYASRIAKGVDLANEARQIISDSINGNRSTEGTLYDTGRLAITALGGAIGGAAAVGSLDIILSTSALALPFSPLLTGLAFAAAAAGGAYLVSEGIRNDFEDWFPDQYPDQDALDLTDDLGHDMSNSSDGSGGRAPGNECGDDENAPHEGGFKDALEEPSATPLVLDLDNDGIELISLFDSNAMFDLYGYGFNNYADGFRELTGWVKADDALLAIDHNGNGIIDDVTELFGNRETDGFIELAALDSNSDGVIDVNDAQFGELLVWQDANENGLSEDSSELSSLSDLGITSIDLNYSTINDTIEGHAVTSISSFTMNGQTQEIVDVWFEFNPSNTHYILPEGYEHDPAVYVLPQLRGFGTVKDLWVAMTDKPALLSLVDTLVRADFSNFSYATFRQDVEDMLFHWADVENVNPATHGPYMDGQIFDAIEAFSIQQNSTLHPLGNASNHYYKLWDKFVDNIAAKLLVQIPKTSFFEGFRDSFTLLRQYEIDNATTIDTLTGAQIDTLIVPTLSAAQTAMNNHPLKLFTDMNYSFTSNEVVGPLGDVIASLSLNEPAGTTEKDAYWQDKIPLINGLADSAQLSDAEFDTALSGSYLDNITTGPASTLRTGIALYGTIGADSLNGSNADDLIIGSKTGHDQWGNITGELGNDTLYGGLGNDRLEGKQDDDVYIYHLGDGDDTISDVGGDDRILFGAGITANDLTFSRTEYDDTVLLFRFDVNDLTITMSNGQKIVIEDQFGDDWLVETIEFSDGSTMGWEQMLSLAGFYTGQETADLITGGNYDDAFDGAGGDDTIGGGDRGNDTLLGGDGDDDLTGWDDHDWLDGGNGNDALIGWTGNDTLWGGADGDLLDGGGDNDTIYGGTGNDTIIGSTGDDRLYGQEGADIYRWSQNGGYDRIYADQSNGNNDAIELISSITWYDLYWEWSDNHLYVGSAADNNYDFAEVGGSIRLHDFRNGSDSVAYIEANTTFNSYYTDTTNNDNGGLSRLVLTSGQTATNQGGYSELIIGTNGADMLTAFGGYRDYIYGADGDDTIMGDSSVYGRGELRGGNGNDVILGGSAIDRLRGDAGDDTLNGGDGADISQGGSGNDIFSFTALSNSTDTQTDRITDFTQGEDKIDVLALGFTAIQAGAGVGNILGYSSNGGITTISNEDGSFMIELDGVIALNNSDLLSGGQTITGTSSADTLTGGAGDDLLEGLGGSDLLSGLGGNDTLLGGDQSDTLHGGDDADSVDGGGGHDTVYGDAGNDTVLGGASGADSLYGGAGNDSLNGESNNDRLFGDDGDDTLMGGSTGTDTLHGGDGNDYLDGESNHDNLYGDAGDDTLLGGSDGMDTLEGGDGHDSLNGGSNHDRLVGDAGNDTLDGGISGADILIGGAGDDLLFGQSSTDTLTGGTGNDTFLYTATVESTGTVTDLITDFTQGEDMIDVSAPGFTGVQAGGGSGTILGFTYDSVADVTTLQNAAGNFAIDLAGNLTLTNADICVAPAGNPITGTNNADTLNGSSDADIITALAGNDDIYGNAGDDTISSGAGDDYLDLGAGNDVILITSITDSSSASGIDYVGGFTQGEDVIDVSALGYTDVSQFSTYQDASYTEIYDNANGFAIGFDSGTLVLTNADFVWAV